jgi:hypothetical protein
MNPRIGRTHWPSNAESSTAGGKKIINNSCDPARLECGWAARRQPVEVLGSAGSIVVVVAATTATASVAATTATASVAATTATASRGSWPGFVHGEPAAIMIAPIKRLDCCLGFVVIGHLDEAEPATSACVTIAQNLR